MTLFAVCIPTWLSQSGACSCLGMQFPPCGLALVVIIFATDIVALCAAIINVEYAGVSFSYGSQCNIGINFNHGHGQNRHYPSRAS